MAIVRTALGTFVNSNASSAVATIASITLSTGDLLVVGAEQHSQLNSTVTWGSESLAASEATNKMMWYKIITTGGTQTITVTAAGNSKSACWATGYSGIASSTPLDKDAFATGNSTTADSGTTATISQGDEVLVGCVGQDGFAAVPGGTWANSFNAGQTTNTTGGSGSSNSGISEGYLIVSATQTAQAKKTSLTNSGVWYAEVATYKMAAAGAATVKQLAALGVG